ncbi:MAG: efflux RND transporter periplasmic adaptor subunit [Verrucomicrobiota bacterium]
MIRTLTFALFAMILVAAAGYWGLPYLQEVQDSAASENLPDLIASVERRSITRTVETAGDIDPAEKVEVKAEVSAKIKRIHFDVGDTVKKGELLIELDARDLLTEKEARQQEITGAKLELQKAERDFDRNQKLFKKELVAEQIFLDARTQRDIAINKFESAKTRLRLVEDKFVKTKILAPMDGSILTMPVIEGQVVVAAASVNSGTVLMEIAQLDKMLIISHVGQVDVTWLESNMSANFTVDSMPGKVMNAKISEISPVASIKRNIKGFTVEMTINTPDPRIRPGMTAMVSVPVETANDVLTVPLAAVFKDEDDKKVAYVRDTQEPPHVEKREVEVGLSNINYAEIKSGLSEQDTVLLTRPKIEYHVKGS